MTALGRWWRVMLLGFLTVGVYGVTVYGFGVLIAPVHDATGWSVGSLASAFTVAALIGGGASVVSGWTLDRFGPRLVMLASLVAGGALLLVASTATSAGTFVVTWGIGGGIIAAGLFYNVTMAITARLYPAQRVRAFAILTFVGGFAAVIYFPLVGLLIDWLAWRMALRVLVGLMALHVLPAALLLRRSHAADPRPAPPAAAGDGAGVLAVFRTREVLQMLAMFSLAGMSFSAIQVHHVPAMEAGGISLGVATTIASARGLLSLPGRALIDPVVRRASLPLALGATYCVMAAGTLPLAVGGSLLGPLVFMLSTGLVFGAISPLQGLYATEVFGLDRIGTLMGVQTLVVSLVSALGPAILGVMVDATGGYGLAIVLASALSLGAFVLLALRPRSSARRPAPTTA